MIKQIIKKTLLLYFGLASIGDYYVSPVRQFSIWDLEMVTTCNAADPLGKQLALIAWRFEVGRLKKQGGFIR